MNPARGDQVRKPRILIFVTGQLRNCVANIHNWLDVGLKGCDVEFRFDVWDDVGRVDLSKAYLRSLPTKLGGSLVQISKNNVYFAKDRILEDELDEIRRLLPNADILVYPYKEDYVKQIGALKVTPAIKADCSPWWRGAIPVAWINQQAWLRYEHESSDLGFDFFARFQSEVRFKNTLLSALPLLSGEILSSPDTIDPSTGVSMKFFAGKSQAFSLLMTAFDPSIEAFKRYQSGSPPGTQPIGERYLKFLCHENQIDVRYPIRTVVDRERLIPALPAWRTRWHVAKNWTLPNLVFLQNPPTR